MTSFRRRSWHHFANDKDYLVYCRPKIEEYLASLRLKIHPIKSQLFETQYGVNFVGFRILSKGDKFPKEVRIRVRNDNLKRSRRRLRQYQLDYAEGRLPLADLV